MSLWGKVMVTIGLFDAFIFGVSMGSNSIGVIDWLCLTAALFAVLIVWTSLGKK